MTREIQVEIPHLSLISHRKYTVILHMEKESLRLLAAEFFHKCFMEHIKAGDNLPCLLFLWQNCASEMPCSRYLQNITNKRNIC